MKLFRSASAILTAVVAGAFLFAGCNEDSIIRANVVPAGDNLEVYNTDTMTLETRSVVDESIVTSTSGNTAIFHALGYVDKDKYSGELTGSIFCQFVPPTTGWKAPTDHSISSVDLVLPYSGFAWGDSNSTAPMTFRVVEIRNGERFNKDSTYYASSTLQTQPTVLGSATVAMSDLKRDSLLRIRLDSDGGQFLSRLLTTYLDADSTFPAFLTAFQGLYIYPDTTAGSGTVMPYFFLNASSQILRHAGLVINARKNGSSKDTAFDFAFVPNTAAHFNRITRHFTDSALILINAGKNADRLLLHNEPGGSMEITLPNIQSLPKGIIDRAEIVITKVPSAEDSRYFEPARLYPLGVDDTGGLYNILDRFPLGSPVPLDFIDGRRRDNINLGTAEYRINIPRELQRAISTMKTSLTIRLNGAQTYPGAYRLVAGAANKNSSDQYRVRLNLVYTRQPL